MDWAFDFFDDGLDDLIQEADELPVLPLNVEEKLHTEEDADMRRIACS